MPAQLLGMKENSSATAMQVVSFVRKGVASRSMGQLVGERAALYGGEDNGAQPFFLVVTAKWAKRVTSLDNAAHVLQEFLVTKGFTDVKLVPAGSPGEVLVCGHKHVQAGTDTICEWADHKSFGAVLYSAGFISSFSDAASETSQIHSAVVG
jgi:hypothetical protein